MRGYESLALKALDPFLLVSEAVLFLIVIEGLHGTT